MATSGSQPYPGNAEFLTTSSPTSGGFLRAWIEANYFYTLSAVFMMLGCKLLIEQTGVVGDPEEFLRVGKAAAILQGYELTVIALAVWIARTFGRLREGFSLFAIALVLALDPTFFSNQFSTMDRPATAAISLALLLLAPAKLYVLDRGIGLKLPRSIYPAFAFTAAAIYGGDYLMGQAYIDQTGAGPLLFLIACWTPFAAALLVTMPAHVVLSDRSLRDTERPLLTPRQARNLPRLLVAIPLTLITFHVVQAGIVYEHFFSGANIGALLIGIAVLIVRNARDFDLLLVTLDLLCGAALGIALASPPEHLSGFIGLAPIGAVALTLYLYGYGRTLERKWLYHVLALSLIGFVYLLGAVGAMAAIGNTAAEGARSAGNFIEMICIGSVRLVAAYHFVLSIVLTIALAFAALLIRRPFVLLLFGLAAVWAIVELLPGSPKQYILELLQGLFAVALLQDRLVRKRKDEGGHALLAFFICGMGLFRWVNTMHPAALCLALIEGLVFLIAGVRARSPEFTLPGTLQLLAIGVLGARRLELSLAEVVIAIGLATFGAGIVVTLLRERLLTIVARRAIVPKPLVGAKPFAELHGGPATEREQ